MRTFVGVRWRGASNETGVIENGDFCFFRLLYLPNLHIQGSIYSFIILCYVAPQWLFNGTKTDDLEWPFCVKICLGSATNGLASPAFGQNCSKTCRATHILSLTKMQPRDPSFQQGKFFWDICGGSLDRGRQISAILGMLSRRTVSQQQLSFLLPCDAMRCTVLVIVILSFRLSVTLVHCVHMVRPTIMISSSYGSSIILVSGDIALGFIRPQSTM